MLNILLPQSILEVVEQGQGGEGGCLAYGKLFFFKYVVLSKKLRFKSPKYRKFKSAKNGMGVSSSNKAERQIS